jgi:hypothetical protein
MKIFVETYPQFKVCMCLWTKGKIIQWSNCVAAEPEDSGMPPFWYGHEPHLSTFISFIPSPWNLS